jgi:hypothetical protein
MTLRRQRTESGGHERPGGEHHGGAGRQPRVDPDEISAGKACGGDVILRGTVGSVVQREESVRTTRCSRRARPAGAAVHARSRPRRRASVGALDIGRPRRARHIVVTPGRARAGRRSHPRSRHRAPWQAERCSPPRCSSTASATGASSSPRRCPPRGGERSRSRPSGGRDGRSAARVSATVKWPEDDRPAIRTPRRRGARTAGAGSASPIPRRPDDTRSA